jgi:chemotaxis protein CheD
MISTAFEKKPETIFIAQGEHAIGSVPSLTISTILGSCVAVCLHDREGADRRDESHPPSGRRRGRLGAVSFGASDMERLMNALLKRGAERSRLQAKVFGGAAMVAGLSDIGARNATFVRSFLSSKAFPPCPRTWAATARGRSGSGRNRDGRNCASSD